MARRIIIGEILNLIKGLGGNPSKFMGTKTNINFLGKGPKESLFQGPIDAQGMQASNFPLATIISEAESAGGYATANKLNDLQLQRLKDNLIQLKKVYMPEQVPNITDMASGTGDLTQEGIASLRGGVKRFPKESHQFMGRPLKDADFAKIDQLVAEGKLPPAEGASGLMTRIQERMNKIKGMADDLGKSDVNVAQILETEGHNIPQMRSAARDALLQLTKADDAVPFAEIDLKYITEGGGGRAGDPINLMVKYFGKNVTENLPKDATKESITKFTEFLMKARDSQGRGIRDPFFDRETIEFVRSADEYVPPFESGGRVDAGGLAEILQVPRTGFKYGSIAKNVLAILNRNKKNAEYMFKASDNVSPGYAKGDMKYNAELLAEQLADDAGVVYDDLDHIARSEFYGTAYQYLAKEMGMMKKIMGEVDESMARQALHQWNPPKGRKPNASGGLAKILEV
mgnify:CR=1 FL=1